METNPQQITVVDPKQLTVHPIARDLPELADDDPDFLALLENIRLLGVEYPLDIDGENQILDGRHRWRCAKRLGLTAVPVIVRAQEEAAQIILTSLALRRHYTKAALAYSILPMLTGDTEKGLLTQRAPSQVVQAQRLGISRTLFQSALRVHEMFAEDPDYREKMLPRILRDGLGLGAVIAGYAGRKATNGKAKTTRDGLCLFVETWEEEQQRFRLFELFTPDEQTRFWGHVRSRMDNLTSQQCKDMSNYHGQLAKEFKKAARAHEQE